MAMKLKDYEVKKYECWLQETEGKLSSLMKRKLLTIKETVETVKSVITLRQIIINLK